MAEETAIVPSENASQVDAAEHACIPGTDVKYILPFGKDRFYVPVEAVASYPKEANMCEDRETIVSILTTKAVGSWGQYCDPDKLIKLNAFDHQRNESFSCVYTTFGINGESSPEERVLRQISAIVADKNFGTWRSNFSSMDFNESMDSIENNAKEIEDEAKANEFRENSIQELEMFKKRLEVLNWTKSVDSPVHSSINPSFQGWEKVEKSSDDFKLKICSKAESKKSKSEAITTSADVDEDGEPPPAKTQKTSASGSSSGGSSGKSAIKVQISEAVKEAKSEFEAKRKRQIPGVKWQRSFMVGPEGTFTISNGPGCVLLTQFDYEEEEAAEGQE